jgi:hypothetical protein
MKLMLQFYLQLYPYGKNKKTNAYPWVSRLS